MGAENKRAEIGVYDGESKAYTRPAYDAYWAADHQERLLEVGPRGAFEQLVERYANGDVLVVGCGTGANVRWLAAAGRNRRVAGIEVSATRLAEARTHCRGLEVDLCRADAERLPFADKTFDTVVAHSVLHHLPEWRGDGLDALVRVLDDEGALLFYEPDCTTRLQYFAGGCSPRKSIRQRRRRSTPKSCGQCSQDGSPTCQSSFTVCCRT